MRALRVFALPLLGLMVSFAAEHEARACSGGCAQSEAEPPTGTALPANAIGIAWRPTSGVVGPDPVLYDELTGLELPIVRYDSPSIVFVRPMDPSVPGQSYRFETPQDDCTAPLVRTQLAMEPAPFSEIALGTLVAADPFLGSVGVPADVSCSEEVDALLVDIELQLAPELVPFADALMYETHVDGEPWTYTPSYFYDDPLGAGWPGHRGEDQLVELCVDGVGGSPAPHVVQMKARMVGSPEIVLESNLIEVILDCSMVPEAADGSGSGSGSGDTGDTSGATQEEDTKGEGCGCRSYGSGPGPMALLLPLALVGLRRRREPLLGMRQPATPMKDIIWPMPAPSRRYEK